MTERIRTGADAQSGSDCFKSVPCRIYRKWTETSLNREGEISWRRGKKTCTLCHTNTLRSGCPRLHHENICVILQDLRNPIGSHEFSWPHHTFMQHRGTREFTILLLFEWRPRVNQKRVDPRWDVWRSASTEVTFGSSASSPVETGGVLNLVFSKKHQWGSFWPVWCSFENFSHEQRFMSSQCTKLILRLCGLAARKPVLFNSSS